MKNFIINKCINLIKNNSNYNNEKLEEIKYGLLSIYLTISKIIVILIISTLLRITKEVLIFMGIYNVIRLTAFGIHATKSYICLISSILIFIGIPYICINFKFDMLFIIILGIINVLLIFKNSPADTYKRPIINKKRRKVYKILSTIISIIYFILSIIINNNYISNCLMLSIILENILISPITYKLFKLPYNNYINFLKNNPEYLDKV